MPNILDYNKKLYIIFDKVFDIRYNGYMGIKIEFISMVEGLEQIEECRPKPAKYFIPEWFKNIPPSNNTTVRHCPSFPDYFSQGFVIPMWMDSKLNYDKSTGVWNSQASKVLANWTSHPDSQFLDFKTPSFLGSEANFVFKAECPWRIITPPGWSVFQMPLFYNFNKEWSILPGIVDTDIYHEVNQQVLYHGTGEDIIINRGDPFVLYIPFKRDKHDLNVRYRTEKDRKNFLKQDLNVRTKFIGSGAYRKAQRLRDKNEW
jgi:hypothetical protein